LPDVSGGLFLTFTFDQALFASPDAAYDVGRDHLRRMFFRLRRGVTWEGKRCRINAPYCVKLEFHENDWPHFHVVLLTRSFLPGGLLNQLWSFGRTNVERISNEDFRYLLKYVTKGGRLPDWVKSRPRIRVFQSSHGFLAPIAKAEEPSAETKKAPRRRGKNTSTIGQRLERWERSAVFQQGERIDVWRLVRPFCELFDEQVFLAAREGRYLGRRQIMINDQEQLREWLCPKAASQTVS